MTLQGSVGDNEIKHPLTEGRHTIGRSGDCSVRGPYPFVSREHAEVVVESDRIVVRDLESHNGTWVNGARIEEPTTVTNGDRITIADVTFYIFGERAVDTTIISDGSTVETRKKVSWDEVQRLESEDADKTTRLYQVLAKAGELLAVQRPPEELFEAILDLVERMVEAERTMLLLREEGSAEPVVKASRLHGPRREDRIVLSSTMVQQVIQEKESFLTTDAQEDPRFQSHESVIFQRTRSAMAAPLFDNQKVIGVLYADTTDPITQYTDEELRTFMILANLVAVKITQARLEAAEAERRQMEMELRTARDIMTRILPSELERVEGYELCAYQEPCHTVGGDLYQICRLEDGRVVILMGDVSGKGLGAALLVSTIMPIVNVLSEDVAEPITLMDRLNRQVFQSTDAVRFATVFLGVLEPGTGKLEYVNAGHNPPLLIDGDGTTREIAATGLPVGMFEETSYEAGTVDVKRGEMLMLYSDGIPEALNADDDEYGMERFADLLRRERAQGLEELLLCVQDDISEFVGDTPPSDDVTMLLIRRQ